MARRVKDSNLQDGTARLGLKVPTGSIRWRLIGAGLHLGWRRGKTDGRWLIRRYQGDGKYVVETLAIADDFSSADGSTVLSFAQAQDAARSRVAAVAEAAKAKPYTVRDALNDYVEHLEGLGKASAYDVRLRLKACVPDDLGTVLLAELDASRLAKWHHAMAKAPARKRTKVGKPQQFQPRAKDADAIRARKVSANRVLASVKAALNHALASGKIETDAGWKRVKPFAKVDEARAEYLQLAECLRLVNAAQGDFRNLVRAALETGARYGELMRLRVQDFNPDSGTLHIRQAKSGKPRHIVLTDDGIAFFRQLATGRAGVDLMLMRGDREWKRSEQTVPMIEACKHAGIAPLGLHQLRHTWASHAVMNGTPLLVVARNLGHVDTRMVEKHYGHLAPSFITDAIRTGAPRYGIAPEPNNVRAIR